MNENILIANLQIHPPRNQIDLKLDFVSDDSNSRIMWEVYHKSPLYFEIGKKLEFIVFELIDRKLVSLIYGTIKSIIIEYIVKHSIDNYFFKFNHMLNITQIKFVNSIYPVMDSVYELVKEESDEYSDEELTGSDGSWFSGNWEVVDDKI